MTQPHIPDITRYGYRILAAGLTWVVVTLAYLSPIEPAQWGSGQWWGLVGSLLYGAGIYTAIKRVGATPSNRLAVRYAGLLLAAAALLLMLASHPEGVVFILAIVIAGITPEFFTLRKAALLQLALHCTMTLTFMLRWDLGPGFIWETLLWLAFEVFALLTSQIAAEERRTRQDLEFSHSQLAATQAMLASTSRQEERLRISRDIHDVMGHHLTGLSLQLEVASHSDGDKARQHIAQAQLIAKLLLSDVRQVVSDLRDAQSLDLEQALRSLTDFAGQMQVELELPPALAVSDARIAEAVFRAVQEILTNAVRHSGASRLNIALQQEGELLQISAADNGGLNTLPQAGNGLSGMRERIEALGGSLKLRADRGLHYDIRLGGA